MIKEVTAVGKDILEAQENARIALGAGDLADVQFEIVDAGSKGIFGIIGVRPAKVRAFVELPDATEKRQRNDRPKRESKGGEGKKTERREDRKPKTKKPEKKAEKKNDEPKVSAPKSEVIPEAELKMERRIVSEGEDMSFDFVKTVIADIGLNAEAELYSCEDGTRRITIVGDDASALIGHHGDTLDALQYLANLASARKNIKGERDKSRVTLDIEGYRKKREETLRALARRMAAKALRNRRSVMLEPMSAYERRIIHSEIQGIEGVSTNSIGSDNNRKIVIFLTDKKPQGIFEEKKTPLNEEFAENEEDVRIDDIDESVSLGNEENETLTVKQTYPDESETYADALDDSDIK